MSLRHPLPSLPALDVGGTSAGGRTVPVVAAVIRRESRLLVGRRPLHKRHGGLWEFPGGKLLVGEDLAAAAARELREELGLELRAVGAILFDAADPESPFMVRFLEVEVDGSPVPREHDAVGWFTPAELGRLPLAPSDARFVREVLARG
jgi:8-oxo-dGTP pyrophosphatase MutT (NUDIX family)